MDTEEVKELNIPKTPGCYRFFDKDGKIIYVGKAADLRSRVSSYWRASADHTPAKRAMLKEIASVSWVETESEIEALLLESNFIKKHQPPYNVVLRDDKRFVYIKISLDDEIPGVFATRKIDRSGKYFGPFTSAGAVRETLKTIRKIWPYCTERRIKPKPCFYAQINRCTGVCGGRFDLKEYREKIIKPIILFLEGGKKDIIKKLESRKKALEKIVGAHDHATDDAVQELTGIKFQLINMHSVLDHANILGVGEKYAADVVELAKILSLPRVPERIEGYDISNIFGREAVGSMVVFSGGEPDKNEYRKFKIKISEGEADDTGMLKEVLERRFQRITHNVERVTHGIKHETRNTKQTEIKRVKESGGWPAPDLIIIDGGKGQLNLGIRVLKKYGLDIPIMSVSKGEGLRSALAPDKIFWPGEAKPLVLPLASPALHIIKRVRDEAHRFAIKYHRELRRKTWLIK
ncbi:MAG: excinuclease ABC subunit UvrC [Candidatus Falkowbacteria bacterium]